MPNTLPHDLEAEKSVLGAGLLDKAALDIIMDSLTTGSFYSQRHATIFAGMRALYDAGRPSDLTTLTSHLRDTHKDKAAGGFSYVSELSDGVITTANIKYWVEILTAKTTLRRAIAECHKISQIAYSNPENVEDFISGAQSTWSAMTDGQARSYATALEVANEAHAGIELLYKAGGQVVAGLSTGLPGLDRLTSGLRAGDLWIFAGRPGMGKTSLALNVLHSVSVRERKKVAFFSLEMSQDQLGERLICQSSKLDFSDLRRGSICKGDWTDLVAATGEVSNGQFFIDDTGGLSVAQLRARCRRIMAAIGGLDLIIVDYIQIMRGSGRSRLEVLTEITGSLKALAKNLKCPVIALSQLSRESLKRDDKRPNLGDLRESGSIEQDADVVLFVHRPALLTGQGNFEDTELIIGKQRNGETGIINLRFIGQQQTFIEGGY